MNPRMPYTDVYDVAPQIRVLLLMRTRHLLIIFTYLAYLLTYVLSCAVLSASSVSQTVRCTCLVYLLDFAGR